MSARLCALLFVSLALFVLVGACSGGGPSVAQLEIEQRLRQSIREDFASDTGELQFYCAALSGLTDREAAQGRALSSTIVVPDDYLVLMRITREECERAFGD